MNDKITRLPQEVILKIAAGEVVERPSSIVKELVENSIDAGSTAITVEIVDGGIKYIRVVDNGSGIKESMLGLAFERHSTSKLSHADDLFHIETLGFRGEALASIAAISKVRLTTKHIDAEEGVTVKNDGGVISEIKPAACSTGTTIVVKDLFYNTPVRLKFLKKPSIEASAITDLMMRLILSNPNVSFRYLSNGKTIFHSIGDSKLESAISRIYDIHTSKNMRKISYHSQGIIISGFLGVLDLEKSNRTHQTFFINGRYFRNEIITNALEAGTRGFVTISKFPMCVLNITVPYHFVDVNVHPNKLDVRFADNELIYSVVKEAVENALHSINIETSISKPFEKSFSKLDQQLLTKIPETEKQEEVAKTSTHTFSSNMFLLEKPAVLNDSANRIAPPPTQWKPQINENAQHINFLTHEENSVSLKPTIEEKLKFIGSLFDSFILLEYEDKLLLLDQHAAQERINYERFMEAYSKDTYSQALLSPILLELSPIEGDVIREYQEELYTMGFEVGFFDESSIAVRSVPIILGEPMSIKTCLHEIFQSLSGKKLDLTAESIRNRILQFACKHSIKAGEKIPQSGIYALIKQMLEDKIAPTCPHGRPIIVEISRNELYRKFKRMQ